MTSDAATAQGIEIEWSEPLGPNPRARSTEGRTIYAIGDVHGCYDLLTALLEAIVADVQAQPTAKPLLVFCGDYIDRGPRSSDVLTSLLWLSRRAALEVTFLSGNHEAMLLGFLERPEEHTRWLRRDGTSTLRNYGVYMPTGDTDEADFDIRQVRDALMDRMPASHLDFLRKLAVRKTCGDYVFVHAGLRPGVSLNLQTDEDCLWIGKDFLDVDHAFEKVVVHGHTWRSDKPQSTSNRIGIDTGAYSTGALTAARLQESSVKFVQARLVRATPGGQQCSTPAT